MTKAEILDYATRVLGTEELARRWLHEPAIGLDGRRPIDLLETADGRQLVEDYLTRIEFGVYT
jgi:putative toxin-antitoxin system antitoxin component (TIGR02293 family)